MDLNNRATVYSEFGAALPMLFMDLVGPPPCLGAHASCLMPHASCLMPHASCLMPHGMKTIASRLSVWFVCRASLLARAACSHHHEAGRVGRADACPPPPPQPRGQGVCLTPFLIGTIWSDSGVGPSTLLWAMLLAPSLSLGLIWATRVVTNDYTVTPLAASAGRKETFVFDFD
jgi:hypothetical protein